MQTRQNFLLEDVAPDDAVMRIVGLAIFRGMTQRISTQIQHTVNQLFVLFILLQVKPHAIHLVDDAMPLLGPLVNSWTMGRIGTCDKGVEQLVDADETLMNGPQTHPHISAASATWFIEPRKEVLDASR